MDFDEFGGIDMYDDIDLGEEMEMFDELLELFGEIDESIDLADMKSRMAEILFRLEAVKLRPEEPFTWASGWKSPIYCDNRVILSSPSDRSAVQMYLSTLMAQEFPEAEAICGVATGAIAMGMLVADLNFLPFSYVRSSAKGHGMENQIEGRIEKGAKVLVVEDLISTGGSSLKAVEALRSAGYDVLGVVANYTHGLPEAEKAFAEADVKLVTITDYDTVIEYAVENDLISEKYLETLREWRKDPANWGK